MYHIHAMYHTLLDTALVSVAGSVSACPLGDSGPTPQRANDKDILFSFLHFHTHVSEKSPPFGILCFSSRPLGQCPLGTRAGHQGQVSRAGYFHHSSGAASFQAPRSSEESDSVKKGDQNKRLQLAGFV